MPRKQWRCFHCDQLFRSEREASIHFGTHLGSGPACKLATHDGGLIEYIRKLENEIDDYRQESHSILRSSMELNFNTRLLVPEAEQRGYDKGVSETFDMLRKAPELLQAEPQEPAGKATSTNNKTASQGQIQTEGVGAPK